MIKATLKLHQLPLSMKKFNLHRFGVGLILLTLFGCALDGGLLMTVGPDYQSPQPSTAKQWSARQPVLDDLPVAHQGEVSSLNQWWQRFNDAVLNRLQAAAQQESASIAKARGSFVASESVFLPTLDASLSSTYSNAAFGDSPSRLDQDQLSVQSSWDIDLFGGLARNREAAVSQWQARTAILARCPRGCGCGVG